MLGPSYGFKHVLNNMCSYIVSIYSRLDSEKVRCKDWIGILQDNLTKL